MGLIISPYQDVLVSGTNIQTVNGTSILGSGNEITDYTLLSDVLLGSSIKGQTYGKSMADIVTNSALADGQIKFTALYIPQAATITGIGWYQVTQGSYTADNNNRIGLYSYSGGNLTQIAACANDGNIWKGASASWVTKNFSSSVPVTAGIYFAVYIYNQSAQVTAPTMGAFTAPTNNAVLSKDFTNSAKIMATLASQTDLPSPTQAMSGLAASTAANVYLYVY